MFSVDECLVEERIRTYYQSKEVEKFIGVVMSDLMKAKFMVDEGMYHSPEDISNAIKNVVDMVRYVEFDPMDCGCPDRI